MADIFISYARADRDKIETLAAALEQQGHTVWWDRQIVGGAEFSEEIERELNAASAVIVAWSKSSLTSTWVKDEALTARDAGKLLPLSIDGAAAPMGFKQYHCIDLQSWNGKPDAPIFLEVSRAVQSLISGVKAPAIAPQPSSKFTLPSMHPSIWIVAIVAIAIVSIIFLATSQNRNKDSLETVQFESADAEISINSRAADPASIAVLPFADLSPESDQEYFSDGMAEEILNVLVRVDGLKVASRTSSFQYKNRNISIPNIADELNVRHILEGSVRKSGNTLRITAQLIDASNDRHLWSETFDRPLTAENIFEIQDETASAIVAALSDVLEGETLVLDQEFNAVQLTNDVDAYELYLRARAMFQSRFKLAEADQLLEQAVANDPHFAKAWELRASIYSIIVEYDENYPDADANYEKAREFVNRALSIDQNSARAIAVAGNIKINQAQGGNVQIDFASTIEDFKRALTIDRNDTAAWNWLGQAYVTIGEVEQSLSAFQQCIAIDPLYTACLENEIVILASLGRDQESFDKFILYMNKGAIKPLYTPLSMLARLEKEALFKTITNGPRAFFGFRRHHEFYEAMKQGGEHTELAAELFEFARDQSVIYDFELPIYLQPIGGAYDMAPFNLYVWDAAFLAYRASPEFKSYVRNNGVYDYWREHGFPPQCRAAGNDDFVCD